MGYEIKKMFYQVIVNSLNTQQVNFLGGKIDDRFNLGHESGFGDHMPVPRQTAAQTLIEYFNDEEAFVNLFTYMLVHEGERFYNRVLAIWGKEDLMAVLRKRKWIFDHDLNHFLRDPFYEREINFLESVRLLDLRNDFPYDDIIARIEDISNRMSIRDLEWKISIRLYDFQTKTGELIKKIIRMLLARQNLQGVTEEIYLCLKELATNASKANYKLLFEKYVTAKEGITSENNYHHFLGLFKNEIGENGIRNLFELARKEDRFYNITFQSTIDSIEVWVTNNSRVSPIEKKQILKKLGILYAWERRLAGESDEFAEGAGLGLYLIQRILSNFTSEKQQISVVFYPETMKVGFQLARAALKNKIAENNDQQIILKED
jgi:hypothetical protein